MYQVDDSMACSLEIEVITVHVSRSEHMCRSPDRKQQEKSRQLPEVHWAVTDFQHLAERRRQQRGSLDSRRSLQGAR